MTIQYTLIEMYQYTYTEQARPDDDDDNEMSWTRTRGACIQIDKNNTNILSETKLPLIVHVSVYKYKNKQDDIPLSPFYYSNISIILQSIFSSGRIKRNTFCDIRNGPQDEREALKGTT